MDNLTDVITAAVEDAAQPETAAETTETVETTPEALAAAAAATTETPETAETKPTDEVEAVLDTMGIKSPIEGQRENRIPYTRVKKIVEKAIREREQKFDEEKKGFTEKLTKAEEREKRLALLEQVDQLATNDPARYIELLKRANPAYERYFATQQQQQATTPPPAQLQANDPMPQPDHKFEDGSLGYTQEGLQKWQDWTARQAKTQALAEARAEWDKRFGPIEKQWNAAQLVESQKPIIQQKIKAAEATWGESFTKYRDDIAAELSKDQSVPFEQVVARVLLPKMKADHEAALNSSRERILKEMKERPAAATRIAAPVKSGVQDQAGPRTTEDVIRESIAAANIR